MKKLILTSAAILFIGLTSFAQDGGKCAKKCEKKCDIKECVKDGGCTKKCGANESASNMKCNHDNTNSCAKKCKTEESKGNGNNGTVK